MKFGETPWRRDKNWSAIVLIWLASISYLCKCTNYAYGDDFVLEIELREEIASLTDDDVKLQKMKSVMALKPEYALGPNAVINANFRSYYDLRYDLDDDYSRATMDRGKSQTQIRKLELLLREEKTDWILGRQIITWGRADGIRLLDTVNPLDLREFILEDYADSKIPLTMLNRKQFFSNWSWQLLIIPEYEPNRYAPKGSDYYDKFNDPARAEEIGGEDPTGFGLKGSAVGTELSCSLTGIDLSLNYLYKRDDSFVVEMNPVMTSTGPVIIPEKKFDRVHLMGGSFAGSSSRFVIRGEAVYIIGRRFFLKDDALNSAIANDPDGKGLSRNDEFQGLLGVDFSKDGWLLSFQVYYDLILGKTQTIKRYSSEQILTGLIRKEFFNNILQVKMLSLYVVQEQAWLLQPRIVYQYNDDIDVLLGGDIFAANSENGLFSQYREKSRLLLMLNYRQLWN